LEGDFTLEGYIGPISITGVPGVNTSKGVMGIEGLNGAGAIILVSVPVHASAEGQLMDRLAHCDIIAFRRRRREINADGCASTCAKNATRLSTCRGSSSGRSRGARLRHLHRPTMGTDPSRILLAARLGNCGIAEPRGPIATLPGALLLDNWRVTLIAVVGNSSLSCGAGRADGPRPRRVAMLLNWVSTAGRGRTSG
jgi:hypothetical protein